MTPRRQYLATLVLLAAGGVLGFAAAARPWGSARTPSTLSGVTEVSVSGSDLSPVAPALCLVALAAVVAVPAVRQVGRRVVGAVLTVLGCGLALVAVQALLDLEARIRRWVADSPGLAGSVDEVSASPWWPVALAVAGGMILAAGVLMVVRGPSWPSMGARYERPQSPRGDATPGSGDSSTDPRQAWDALDRGDDPT